VPKLIYTSLASLDGYIADEEGAFDWAVPDEEVLVFLNDLERSVGTYLYGRRMYELMIGWETDPAAAAQSAASGDFARIWQAADKVVYSTTLTAVSTARTRLERSFDADAVRRLKEAATQDLNVSGPDLAADALRAGVVDEFNVVIAPVVVGGGKRLFPDHLRVDLELLEQRRFDNGMAYLRYRTTSD